MKYLNKKRVLVTGAAGSIGSELCRQLLKNTSARVYALDFDETGLFELDRELDIDPIIANIRDQDRLNKIFGKYEPKVVFHAAAYKHVPLMEKFPEEANKTNIEGTRNLILAAKRVPVSKFIFVSSDKAANPTSVMGRTKRRAEEIVKENGHICVRFGNVLGSRGSIVPIWSKQIEKGEPLTITSPKMKRYFMSIVEACGLILKAGEIGKPGEVLALDMGDPIKIITLAKTMIKLSGKDIEIKTIGVRPGEKMEEVLWEDGDIIEKREGIWVIK